MMVTLRLNEFDAALLEQLVERSEGNRSEVIRDLIHRAAAGSLVETQVARKFLAEVERRGLRQTDAVEQALRTWLNLQAQLDEVDRPRHFPPREVLLTLKEKRKLLMALLG